MVVLYTYIIYYYCCWYVAVWIVHGHPAAALLSLRHVVQRRGSNANYRPAESSILESGQQCSLEV